MAAVKSSSCLAWIIPGKRDAGLFDDERNDPFGPDFNAPLTEQVTDSSHTDGGEVVNDDIAAGRVKRYATVDDMLRGLDQPWDQK